MEVTPANAALAAGETQQFTVLGRMSDGSATSVAVTWSETGGTISGTGLYTAGATGGTFRVIAVQQGDTKADTAGVTITVAAPTLTAVEVTPATATVAARGDAAVQRGGADERQQHRERDGDVECDRWDDHAGGLYTAGTPAGSYRVIAVEQGGTKADTSAVTVTAPRRRRTGRRIRRCCRW